jgi:hypothetical protein
MWVLYSIMHHPIDVSVVNVLKGIGEVLIPRDFLE